MQVLGDRSLSLFVSHLNPLKPLKVSLISRLEARQGEFGSQLEDPSPLKMVCLSCLGEGSWQEERLLSSPSLPLLNCRSGAVPASVAVDNQHFIFRPEIGLVSSWEGLLQRKCQLITSIVRTETNQLPDWKTNIFKLKYFLNSGCDNDCWSTFNKVQLKVGLVMALTVDCNSVQRGEVRWGEGIDLFQPIINQVIETEIQTKTPCWPHCAGCYQRFQAHIVRYSVGLKISSCSQYCTGWRGRSSLT